MIAPLDVVLGPDTVVEPDVLVAPRTAFTDRDLPGPPLLAVEVLSPTTRHLDLHLKRAGYEATVRLDHPFPVSVRPADLIL